MRQGRRCGKPAVVCGVLALLFIAIPALEIYLIIAVGGWLGALPTVGIIFATGIAGAALAKHQGLATIRRLQASMQALDEVGRSMAEAALVLVAGVLMLTPGFLTDITGILLLIPPVRALVAERLVEYGRARMQMRTMTIDDLRGAGPAAAPEAERDDVEPPPPGVIDV